jgi:hypothetical protein
MLLCDLRGISRKLVEGRGPAVHVAVAALGIEEGPLVEGRDRLAVLLFEGDRDKRLDAHGQAVSYAIGVTALRLNGTRFTYVHTVTSRQWPSRVRCKLGLEGIVSKRKESLALKSNPRQRALIEKGIDRAMSAGRCRQTDCVAGHVRLELRNVGTNYAFEKSRRFLGSRRILATETIGV